jgi:hypothetical protein
LLGLDRRCWLHRRRALLDILDRRRRISDALDAFFEASEALAKAFTQLREALSAEKYKRNNSQDDQMRRLK